MHIGRGLYYGSYQNPRTLVWSIGVVIFILMMAIIKKWPNWILINIINKGGTRCLSLLPFNRARTRAILRVGPHSKDVLSIIVCGMLGDWWADEIKGQILSSVRFNIEQSVKNYSTSKSVLAPEGNPKSKPKKRLTNFERRQISLPKDLQEILIGLLLGGVCAQDQKRLTKGRTCLYFEQSIKNKDYIFHLFELFKHHSRSEPKISERIADKRSGKIYTRVQFATNALSCFNELYHTFYPKGKKIVPWNIEELLTPLGLAYWICDEGSFQKKHKCINIVTNSYTLQEVDLLLGVLRSKFNLSCTIKEERTGYIITIAASSVLYLQSILKPIMPSMMMHKIGLNAGESA